MSTPATGPQPPLNRYGEVWGGSLVGTFIAAVIYGITIAQTFYYYKHYSTDRVTWKWLVAFIFVLDTSALALCMYSVYYYLVLSWGMPEMLAPDVKPFPAEYFITSFLVFVVQCFYINTIYALRSPIIVTIGLFGLSSTALGTGLILPIIQLKLRDVMAIVVYPLNHIAFNIARGTALACDLGIVVALCWQLGIRKTEVKRANSMINLLILIAVQRGVLQAVIQLGEVLAYIIKPDGVFFIPFHVIVSRIYCISLLSSLNSRDWIAAKGMPTYMRKRRDEESESRPPISQRVSRIADAVSASTRPVFTSLIEPSFMETSTGNGNHTRRSDEDGPAFPPGVSFLGLDSQGSEKGSRAGARNQAGQTASQSSLEKSDLEK